MAWDGTRRMDTFHPVLFICTPGSILSPFLPYSVLCKVDPWGLHHPDSLAGWLIVGFDQWDAMVIYCSVEGEMAQSMSLPAPSLCGRPLSGKHYILPFPLEMSPWLQLSLGSWSILALVLGILSAFYYFLLPHNFLLVPWARPILL